MLSALAILLIALCMSGQPHSATNKEQHPAPQSKPAVVSANAPNEQPDGQENEAAPNPKPPRWYAPLQRPDWWVVIFAGITGGVICWQSYETRRAAKATGVAAVATERLLLASIAKDRARLRVDLQKPKFDYNAVPEVQSYSGHVVLGLTHHGSTEARVHYAEGEMIFAETEKANPDYLPPDIKLPSKTIGNETDLGKVSLKIQRVLPDTLNAMYTGKSILHLYGIITYWDLFSSDPHETSFYYTWRQNSPEEEGRWIVQDCPGYNKET